MSDPINIRSKPTRAPSVPTSEIGGSSSPLSAKISADLKDAVIQMDSIETSKYKVKDTEPRSPAPLPESISPAGIPIDLNDSLLVDDENEDEVEGEKRFKIDLGSYQVMDHTVDVTMKGSNPTEYKRNGKGSLIIAGLVLLSLHLIAQHCTMFTWVIKYESPDLIMATVLYFISSLCLLFLMMAMLVMPGLSIKEENFTSYYGVIILAGGLDFVAVMIGGSAFSPLGFYSEDVSSYVSYYWMALLECLVINGLIYYAFSRKSEDGKLFDLFHPFVGTKAQDSTESEEV